MEDDRYDDRDRGRVNFLRKERHCSIEREAYTGYHQIERAKADLARKFDALNLKADIAKFSKTYEDRKQHKLAREIAREAQDIPVARMNGELTRGRVIQMKTNNYALDFKSNDAVFYIYQFSANVVASAKYGPSRAPLPNVKKENKRKIVGVLSQILGIKFAFDGDNMLISPREFIRFQELGNRDGSVYESQSRDGKDIVEFRVTYSTGNKKETAEGTLELKRQRVEMKALFDFMESGGEHPPEVIQAIEIILRTNPALQAAAISKGRAAFCPIANKDADRRIIPRGREVWHGIHQSAKISNWKGIGTKVTLNVDLAYGMFMEHKCIADILRDSYDPDNLQELADSIKHLNIQVMGEDGKYYKFEGFGPICRETRLGDEYSDYSPNGNFPVVITTAKADGGGRGRGCGGGRGRDRGGGKKMFPADMCRLLAGQKPKVISADDKAQLLRASAEAAPVRQAKIQEIVETKELFDDQMLENFGMRINKEAMRAEGRVLDMPAITANAGKLVDVEKSKGEGNGTWNVNTFNKAAEVPMWGRICIGSQIRDRQTWDNFGQMFVEVGRKLGVKIQSQPALDIKIDSGFEFDQVVNDYAARGKLLHTLPFLLVCVPDSGHDYEVVKSIAELNHGILTQMVRSTNVIRPDEAMLKNLWYKLNAKLGGENWRINVPLPPSPTPLMIMGMSISHADPDSIDPSLVGFLASTTQGGTGFVNYVHHQDPRLYIIHKDTLKKALKHLIGQFMSKNNGAKPERIIIYRGGASEGAIQSILKNELMEGIRKNLTELDMSYQPGITFICSVRGSKQKFFCVNDEDKDGMGENIPAGTVVAGYGNGLPDSYSFHLASQAACGTVNPTFYQVLHDDNNIELQNMAEMTYALSLATMRANRATSECAPVRLASIVAERARAHWKGSKKVEDELTKFRGCFKNHYQRTAVRQVFEDSLFFI